MHDPGAQTPAASARSRASPPTGALFGFTQLEFGFELGPTDGRYLIRPAPDEAVERVLVLGTLGARERRLLSRGRPSEVETAPPEPVPTTRATVVDVEPFSSRDEADRWLDQLKRDQRRTTQWLTDGVGYLNRALRAYRAAAGASHVREVAVDSALVVRIGFGAGELVADGEFARAFELPPERKRVRRSMPTSDARFAAILSGRESVLACEELVLRARLDLDAGALREAALQARIALETLLAEFEGEAPDSDSAATRRLADVSERRGQVAEAAAAALRGELPAELEQPVAEAIVRLEKILKAHRWGV